MKEIRGLREKILHLHRKQEESEDNIYLYFSDTLKIDLLKYLKEAVEVSKDDGQYYKETEMLWYTLIKWIYIKIKNAKRVENKNIMDISTWYDLDQIFCWYPIRSISYMKRRK